MTVAKQPGPRQPAFENALAPARTVRAPLVGAIIATLVIAACLVSWLVWRQYGNAKHEAEQELHARAVLAATVFDTYFTGQLNALAAIASSPSVMAEDVPSMTSYFAAFRPGRKGNPFPTGVGWVDLTGHQRATSDPNGPTTLSVRNRSYFKQVVRTGKPFVSEAIVGRTSNRRLLVMSVPTRNAQGRLTGVLATGLVLQQSRSDSRANELGYQGLQVLDRDGQQLTRRDLARPENHALAARLRTGDGVIVDTKGLGGDSDHVVAYATSKVPAWTTVLDQPASSVFASARRTLWIESSLVAVAAVILLALFTWAVRRTRRELQQEHDLAVLLQESLLPLELSTGEGVVVAAHYQAGVDYAAVGGDWYDVVHRPDGLTHLTVGDVAGKGIEAAVLMGQLRNAFRAYALDHASPVDVIERMRRHVSDGEMATMVCVTYDPLTGALAYASAGHPPPLLLEATRGTVLRLDEAVGQPLGWGRQHAVRDGQTFVTDASTLALYTDGLVERRSSSLDRDIDRLADVLREVVGQGGNAGTVVERMLGAAGEDDVALMLATFTVVPRTVHIDIPAEPLEVRALRPRIRRWLEIRGMEESAREAIVLGLCEACNNAVEHGYRDTAGRIRIRLDHVDGKVTIRIADDGTWREPIADPTRGRGFVLMKGLTDYMDVVRGGGGTEVLLEKELADSTWGDGARSSSHVSGGRG